MTGVVAVRAALAADTALTALVPVEKIVTGPIPQDTALPALSLESISTVDLNIPSPSGTRFVTERVQVTILANTEPQRRAVKAAVKKACADKLNVTVSGLSSVSIHTLSAGPDMMSEDASVWQASQDLRVKYNEATS